jgi:E3 ubiquitin-protein ligase NEDD4
MSNPFYGMFEYSTHDKSRLQIYPASSVNAEQLDYFKFIGRFVGLGIFHRCPLDVSFIVGFCKMMLDKKVILADLESMDAELHHTLTWVL